MELSSKRKTKEIKIDGEPVSILVPSAKELHEFEQSTRGKDDFFVQTIEFLSNLGVDKNILENLDIETLEAFITFVAPKKK